MIQADTCDPLVTFDNRTPTDDNLDGVEIRIPVSAEPTAGTDRNLLVVQPDHRTVVEAWIAHRVTDDLWQAGGLELVDLQGSGIGPLNGVRAYGGSAPGGLIRRWAVDPTDRHHVRRGDGSVGLAGERTGPSSSAAALSRIRAQLVVVP